MFKCEQCGKVLWTQYERIPDGETVCVDCFNKYLGEKQSRQIKERNQRIQQLYDSLEKKNLHNILNNFMQKYHNNIDEKLPKLIKLLDLKYKTTVDRDIFVDVLWQIKNEYDEKRELDEFEKEITGDNKKTTRSFYCSKCGCQIDEKTFFYSKEHFDKPLCLKCQGTKQQRNLFFALKERGVPCEYEATDGKKHVDIAIHDIKLYIEIDGSHHYTDSKQMFADLMRDKYSSAGGYQTKRFNNKFVEENLDKIADALADVYKKI